MAACKSTLDTSGILPVIKVRAADLPITCKLLSPPAGVSIAVAEFFPAGGGAAANFAVSAAGTFQVIGLTAGTTGRLSVLITGSLSAGDTVFVVEDCDAQTPLVAITGPLSKSASTSMAVL